MKRAYKAPMAKMVDFKYDEQVNATSPSPTPWYCFVTIWQGPTPTSGCQNPNEWTGAQIYLTQESGLW